VYAPEGIYEKLPQQQGRVRNPSSDFRHLSPQTTHIHRMYRGQCFEERVPGLFGQAPVGYRRKKSLKSADSSLTMSIRIHHCTRHDQKMTNSVSVKHMKYKHSMNNLREF
jgi:hypothetical protein